VPKKIVHVAEVPVLGTGKTDYVRIQKMAELDKAA
jgi:acyl-[acyl-carrier-protein]-phospholipid O-acyltransferase/long-chain-fatty-acid--[acyl-carrier-protein] ligase